MRPANWEETKIKRCIHVQGIPEAGVKPDTCDTCPTNIKECHKDFEAGADAMLDALKATGVFTYGNHTPDIDLADAPEVSGYWAFIPDEANNEQG